MDRIVFPYDLLYLKSGPTVNGHVHWLVESFPGSQVEPYLIVSFHPHTNEFVKVPLPQHELRKETTVIGIGVLDGCLSLALTQDHICRTNMTDVEVFAVKKSGDKASWTSSFTAFNLIGLNVIDFLVPLCSTENRELLIRWIVGMHQGILAHGPKHNLYRFSNPNKR